MHHIQSAYQVLLLSANNKIAHLTRTLTTTDSSAPAARFVQEFDNIILSAFQKIMSCPSLSHQQKTQLRLPERFSGLGLTSASQSAPAAFLGCARQSLHELIQRNISHTQFDRLFQNNELNQSIPWVSCLLENWTSYSQLLGLHNASDHPPAWSTNMFLSLPNSHLQRTLAYNLSKAIQANLISSSDPAEKIRLNSCSATGAAAFLRSPAKAHGAFFSNQEFQIAASNSLQ